MLTAQGIGKTFGRSRALCDVSLEAQRGAATVVIGPSGGGKSTLLRCLALLEQPDAGAISIDAVRHVFPAAGPQPPPPWPELTVVFQRHFLWPHLTNRQNISLPLRRRLPRAEIAVRVQQLVEQFEMTGFIDRHPNETSVGQQQRVALARAIALDPSYILLDEVTASLDVEQIARLHDILSDLMQRGIGIVLVTHHLPFAEAMLRASPGGRIVFLDSGRLVGTGDVGILTHPPQGRVGDFIARMRIAG